MPSLAVLGPPRPRTGMPRSPHAQATNACDGWLGAHSRCPMPPAATSPATDINGLVVPVIPTATPSGTPTPTATTTATPPQTATATATATPPQTTTPAAIA